MKHRVMKRWRVIVAVIAVVVWGLTAPLALASSNCMAMGAMGEGPCGASSCAVAQFAGGTALDQATREIAQSADHVVSAPLKVPELPPKSLSHSA